MQLPVETPSSAVPRVPRPQTTASQAYVDYTRRKGLLGLLLKNVGLIVLTLSLYRFWARTELRRFFWSSISIAGDRLEYTGRGIELFIGFLIAVAILAPLGFAYNQIELMLTSEPVAAIIVWAVYVLLLACLTHVARYRARRYRLSRTRWRGIRLGQQGSTLAYLGLALLWSFIQIVTVTLATPWKRAALRGYIVRHSWFGDRQFGFAPRPLAVLPYWIAVVILGFGPLILVGFANADGIAAFLRDLSTIGAPQPRVRIAAPRRAIPFSYGWLLLVGPIAWAIAFAVYRVAEARMFVAASSLGAVRLHSSLRPRDVLPVVIGFLVIMVGGGGAAVFGGFTFMGSLFAGRASFGPAAPLIVFAIGVLLSLGFIALSYYIAMNALVRQTILRKFCESLRIENLASLDDVRQSADTAPRRGEGLADSFEFGG